MKKRIEGNVGNEVLLSFKRVQVRHERLGAEVRAMKTFEA